jgi:hypothetical protein
MDRSIDLDYRPRTYWLQDAAAYIISRISGSVRRAEAERIYAEGGLSALQGWRTQEQLSDADRKAWSSVHPAMMGGEYLPELAEDEVEIARITVASTMGDVVSVRARKIAPDRIRFSVVDEYHDQLDEDDDDDGDGPTQYRFTPKTAAHPLSLREVVALIESMAHTGASDYHPNPIWSFIQTCEESSSCHLLYDQAVDDETASHTFDGQVVVTSTFYPELEDYDARPGALESSPWITCPYCPRLRRRVFFSPLFALLRGVLPRRRSRRRSPCGRRIRSPPSD